MAGTLQDVASKPLGSSRAGGNVGIGDGGPKDPALDLRRGLADFDQRVRAATGWGYGLTAVLSPRLAVPTRAQEPTCCPPWVLHRMSLRKRSPCHQKQRWWRAGSEQGSLGHCLGGGDIPHQRALVGGLQNTGRRVLHADRQTARAQLSDLCGGGSVRGSLDTEDTSSGMPLGAGYLLPRVRSVRGPWPLSVPSREQPPCVPGAPGVALAAARPCSLWPAHTPGGHGWDISGHRLLKVWGSERPFCRQCLDDTHS